MYSNFYQDKFDHFFGSDGLKLGQETWRLFVDGKQQEELDEQGWVKFERREPGCLRGIFQALVAQREKMNEDISLDLICDIHKKCTAETERLQKHNQAGKLRSTAAQVFFGQATAYTFMDEDTCGYEKPSPTQILAREEWKSKIEAEVNRVLSREQPFSLFKYSTMGIPGTSSQITRVVPNIGGADLKTVGEHFIEEYNKKMRQLITGSLEYKEKDERQSMLNDAYLDEIINLVTILERLHLFPDANGRTLCTVLLNRELIKYGYSPVILDNPNMFDGCCHETIKAKIKEGMLRFNAIKEGKIPEGYVKTTDVMDSFNQEKVRHYYYDPLKVLSAPIVPLHKLFENMREGHYYTAAQYIEQLLKPSVLPPESGDIDIVAKIRFYKALFNQKYRGQRGAGEEEDQYTADDLLNNPEIAEQVLEDSDSQIRQLFSCVKGLDALRKLMEAPPLALTAPPSLPSPKHR